MRPGSRPLCRPSKCCWIRAKPRAASPSKPAAVDSFILKGRLVEEAIEDHDVLKHYANGADLVDDFAAKERRIPDRALLRVRSVTRPCVTRERCRLRRLVRFR